MIGLDDAIAGKLSGAITKLIDRPKKVTIQDEINSIEQMKQKASDVLAYNQQQIKDLNETLASRDMSAAVSASAPPVDNRSSPNYILYAAVAAAVLAILFVFKKKKR